MIVSCEQAHRHRRRSTPGGSAQRLRAGWCEVAEPVQPASGVARLPAARGRRRDRVLDAPRAPPVRRPSGPRDRGHRTLFQYTITGYGRPLERRRLRSRPRSPRSGPSPSASPLVRWSGATTRSWSVRHCPPPSTGETFARLAAGLEGSARRVVISLVDLYREPAAAWAGSCAGARTSAEDPATWPGLDDLLTTWCCTARDARLRGRGLRGGARPLAARASRLRSASTTGSWPSSSAGRGRRARTAASARRAAAFPAGTSVVRDTCLFGCRYC